MILRRAGEILTRALLLTACLASNSASADQSCDYSIEDHAGTLDNLISELMEPSERPEVNQVVWHWSDDRHEYAMVHGCVHVTIEVGVIFRLPAFGTDIDVQRHAIDIAYSFMHEWDYQRLTEALEDEDYSTAGPRVVDGVRFFDLFISHPLGEIIVSRETSGDEDRISVSWPIH